MTQTETILAHLQSGGSITPIDALRLYGCFRLAARIKDLRDSGHKVHTDGDCKHDDGGKPASNGAPPHTQLLKFP